MKVLRHKTAINRSSFSTPVRKALEGGLIRSNSSFFDYGCGKGEDVHRLHKLGFEAFGWDPVHNPTADVLSADIVNLGYVLNVIESKSERIAVLKRAWVLAKECLLVSVRTIHEINNLDIKYNDGFLTKHSTFQKFFSQTELKSLISEVCKEIPIAVSPGIFFVFKNEIDKLEYLSKSFRPTTFAESDISLEYRNVKEDLVPLLEQLKSFFVARGRLPAVDDFPEDWIKYKQYFFSLRKAFGLIKRAERPEWFEDVTQTRMNDILVLLVKMIFEKRPSFSQLPGELQRDIKALFSSYKYACSEADRLLLSAGSMSIISAACDFCQLGKRTKSALYIHISALEILPPVLRVYELCARVVSGDVIGANIIKLNSKKPQVSYLVYPNFDADPHPCLRESYFVSLADYELKHMTFVDSSNPPILHRKELLLALDDPRRKKFQNLTKQEEKRGLLTSTTRIGTKNGWDTVLKEKGYFLKGHRLFKMKDK